MSRLRNWMVTAFAVCAAMLAGLAWAGQASAALEITELDGELYSLDGAGDPVATTQAGSHPDYGRMYIEFETEPGPGPSPFLPFEYPTESLKDLKVKLPAGLVGNPQAMPKCTDRQLASNLCPNNTQVGYTRLKFAGFTGVGTPGNAGVFNMEPSRPGSPARFGFNVAFTGPIYIDASLRSDGDYGIDIDVSDASQGAGLISSETVLWGTPASPMHDADRGTGAGQLCFLVADPSACSNPSGMPEVPLLTMPTSCTGPVETSLLVDSWQTPAPAGLREASFLSHEPGDPDALVGTEGCDKVPFAPTFEVAPHSPEPGAASGFTVDLRIPQPMSPQAIESGHLRRAEVTLPEGVVMNPSAADGLVGCSEEQVGLGTRGEPACPPASKIGAVTVSTPLLEELMDGEVYLGTQLPDERYRIFLVIRGPGVLVKLKGVVSPDPVTGQLTTTFANNPQLPFDHMRLVFKGGPRAPLVNPRTCGTHTMTSAMTPWSETPPATPSASFEIDCPGVGGGFDPSFEAGTADPGAGQPSSFSIRLSRDNTTQEFRELKDISLPGGLTGNVGSVDLCPDANADAGMCGEESRIGHVQVAAGAGSNPLWVPQAGKKPTGVYLTGPYRDAPFGLSVVVPAQAGPFDLGTVVVRSAIHVDERTAAITSGVDETRLISAEGTQTEVLPGVLPRILEGIVLNQREIRVIVDRPEFMLNPTDCSPKQISASVGGYGGAQAQVSSRFRAADCARLGFAPRFRAQIMNKGRRSTLRSFNPRTRFTVVPRPGDANIGGARVALPSSTILDQSNLDTTCTRAKMAAEDCPEGSLVGYARAWSPLLKRPLQGPVYLAANGGVRPLPDLMAVLDGEIRVSLLGEISTLRTNGKARLQNTFRVVPDAPVNRFVLTMRGGKNHGLLVNSTDLCRSQERGVSVFHGQNGRRHRTALRLSPSFRGCGKVRRQARRKAARDL